MSLQYVVLAEDNRREENPLKSIVSQKQETNRINACAQGGRKLLFV